MHPEIPGPEVRRLSSSHDVEAAIEEYRRVDAAAFGLPPDAAFGRATRPLVDPHRWYTARLDGEPCGGVGSFTSELTLPGGAALAVALVSDVGVLPTHRRRGVLRALMSTQIADLVDDGVPLAALHASEGAIYRRFGYGVATRWRQVRAAARRVTFRPDAPIAPGSLHVVPRGEAHAECAAVHDAARRSRPGGLARGEDWWDVVLGDAEGYLGGSPRRLVMVHRSPQGRTDGYAIYEVDEDWRRGQANHTLRIWELVGESAAVEVALWRCLLAHDLVGTVVGPAPVDHPLWDCVDDPRQVGIDWQQDLLWLRVLDVARVLTARRYDGSGSLVVEVLDDAGHARGSYALVVTDGVARCERTDEAPQVSLDVSDLGEVVLGGPSWRRLERAGRLRSSAPEAVRTADRLFGVDPLPWCWVRF